MSAAAQLVYMRQMPANLVAFSSSQGRQIFRNALSQGTMECYFNLAEQFITQLHPTTCGATTLVMILNSLKIDPEVQWKGIWRWYTEENLHGLRPEHLDLGIHLDAFQHIAKHNKIGIATFYHPMEMKLKDSNQYFDCLHQCQKMADQEHMTAKQSTFQLCLEASARRENFFMVVNTSRQSLGQTGDGHFCPIGGIDLESRMALLMDVARFKYPPQWCPIDMVYQALSPMDKATGMTRGFSLTSRLLDYDNSDSYSQQAMQQWRRNANTNTILPHCLSLQMVYYLFLVLQRIEQGVSKIETELFQHMLELESTIKPQPALQLVQNQQILYDLIADFTFQYPDLMTTICCLLYNTLGGNNYTSGILKEESELISMILGI